MFVTHVTEVSRGKRDGSQFFSWLETSLIGVTATSDRGYGGGSHMGSRNTGVAFGSPVGEIQKNGHKKGHNGHLETVEKWKDCVEIFRWCARRESNSDLGFRRPS